MRPGRHLRIETGFFTKIALCIGAISLASASLFAQDIIPKGTWVLYKRLFNESVVYPEYKWEIDTIVIINELEYRSVGIRKDHDYRMVPRRTTGIYKVKGKSITFISDSGRPEGRERKLRFQLKDDEFLLGQRITPVTTEGDRDPYRSPIMLWEFYKKVD